MPVGSGPLLAAIARLEREKLWPGAVAQALRGWAEITRQKDPQGHAYGCPFATGSMNMTSGRTSSSLSITCLAALPVSYERSSSHLTSRSLPAPSPIRSLRQSNLGGCGIVGTDQRGSSANNRPITRNRADRHWERQVLQIATGAGIIDEVVEQAEAKLLAKKSMWMTKRWRKYRDAPLVDIVENRLRRRVRLGIDDPGTTGARIDRLRRRRIGQ